MKVNLLLFASIREAVGTGSIALDIPEGETVEGLEGDDEELLREGHRPGDPGR